MSDSIRVGNCGLYCPGCEYYTKGCDGCSAHPGGAVWCNENMKCAVYACSTERGVEHCGVCGEFPCETLLGYAYHTEHGDRERLGHCAVRSKIGTAAWLEREASQRAARAEFLAQKSGS